jgi:hypothetical protein
LSLGNSSDLFTRHTCSITKELRYKLIELNDHLIHGVYLFMFFELDAGIL